MIGIANDKLMGIYRGIVRVVDDPLTQGRVRIQVFPFFKGVAEYEALPWAVAAAPLFSGAGSGGCFAIPAVGTHVWVFFENGDFNQPVYLAEAPDGKTGLPAEALVHYPSSRGWKSTSGMYVVFDDSAHVLKIFHSAGTVIQMNDTGEVSITAASKVTVSSLSGTVRLEAAAVQIVGTTVAINPPV